MFSLQTIFGKGDKFYGLLEASAGAARESTSALVELLQAPAGQRSLDKFKLARSQIVVEKIVIFIVGIVVPIAGSHIHS